MLKVLPIFFIAALCFANFGFMTFNTKTEPDDLPALKNHLTQDKNASAQAAPVNEVFDFEDATSDIWLYRDFYYCVFANFWIIYPCTTVYFG